MTAEHEQAFIESFVSPKKKDRYLGFVRKTKTRSKFLDKLYHFSDFDDNFVRQIDSPQQTASQILALLTSLGADSSCFVISAHAELDGQSIPLSEALEEIVGHRDGTIVSYTPGRLAYYEGEGLKQRYLLHRP